MLNNKIILIPNYNGEKYVRETIEKFKIFLPNWTIIVVDDKSNDNSINIIKTLDCILIQKSTNGGYASSVNRGLNYINKKFDINHTFVLIANSDVIPIKELNLQLEDVMHNVQKPFIVGFIEKGFMPLKPTEYEKLPGFLYILSLDVLNKIGYLDERFYMFGEENDYFFRAKLKKINLFQCNLIVDQLSFKSFSDPKKLVFYSVRNSLFLEIKWKRYFKFILKAFYFILFFIILRLFVNKSNPSNRRLTSISYIEGMLTCLIAIFSVRKLMR